MSIHIQITNRHLLAAFDPRSFLMNEDYEMSCLQVLGFKALNGKGKKVSVLCWFIQKTPTYKFQKTENQH